MDQATPHQEAGVRDALADAGVQVLYVPRDFTGELQFLDVGFFSANRQKLLRAASHSNSIESDSGFT